MNEPSILFSHLSTSNQVTGFRMKNSGSPYMIIAGNQIDKNEMSIGKDMRFREHKPRPLEQNVYQFIYVKKAELSS